MANGFRNTDHVKTAIYFHCAACSSQLRPPDRWLGLVLGTRG